MSKLFKKEIQHILLLLCGTFTMAFGFFHMNYQNHLAEGGFIGLALLGRYAFDVPPALTMLLLDIPIFITALFFKGKRFLITSIIGAASLSIFYELFERFSPINMDFNNMPLAAILSGLLTGLGAGLVFRSGAAAGGDDILMIFVSKTTGLKVGTLFVIIDILVLILSSFYLPLPQVLYTVIAIAIAGKVITWTMELGLVSSPVKSSH